MISGIWDKMKGAAREAWTPMANAYDNATGPSDELIGNLADAEAGGAIGSPEQKAAFAAIEADDKKKRDIMGLLSATKAAMGSGGDAESIQHHGGSRSGGTDIQTEDQYAMAMKALTEKYGKFMFNQNF